MEAAYHASDVAERASASVGRLHVRIRLLAAPIDVAVIRPGDGLLYLRRKESSPELSRLTWHWYASSGRPAVVVSAPLDYEQMATYTVPFGICSGRAATSAPTQN
jgi:hypothetical protein